MLASQYLRQVMAGEIPVTEEEVQVFFKETLVPGTEMTDDLHTQIEATATQTEVAPSAWRRSATRLRKGIQIDLYPGQHGARRGMTRAPMTCRSQRSARKFITWARRQGYPDRRG